MYTKSPSVLWPEILPAKQAFPFGAPRGISPEVPSQQSFRLRVSDSAYLWILSPSAPIARHLPLRLADYKLPYHCCQYPCMLITYSSILYGRDNLTWMVKWNKLNKPNRGSRGLYLIYRTMMLMTNSPNISIITTGIGFMTPLVKHPCIRQSN